VQVATVARLIATGDDVLLVVADRERRRRMLRGVLAPERFCGGSVTLVEYAGLRDAAAGYAAVVALDPPADRDGERLLGELSDTMRVHLVWGAAELEFARSVAEAREPLRPALAAVWRAGRVEGRPRALADLPGGTAAGSRCAGVPGHRAPRGGVTGRRPRGGWRRRRPLHCEYGNRRTQPRGTSTRTAPDGAAGARRRLQPQA
ncbi:MAG TPA: hypothetical protein VM823_02285, partial [Gaiellales bacterium]|nr:hypothetical protein [Gaiellales bacterium]